MKLPSRFFLLGLSATLLASCATEDSPPCRRVSATEFMRPHTFKGIPTDEFIGTTQIRQGNSGKMKSDKAFKKVHELGLFHGWAVLWCPADELPADYLRDAPRHPNRPAGGPAAGEKPAG